MVGRKILVARLGRYRDLGDLGPGSLALQEVSNSNSLVPSLLQSFTHVHVNNF